jgi:penicillin-binding protein 1A
MAIRRVVLPGDKVDGGAGWGKKQCRRVLTEGEAYTVTEILEENVQYGTGTGASYGHPAAGKTGTTDDHADAWFCGYTPRLQTTVWVGYPKGEIPMENVHGISVTGGSFPAQIWRIFMSRAIGHLEPVDFEQPAVMPEWRTLEQGQYARSFGYYDDDDDYSAPATTEEEEEEETPATTAPPAAPAPPPPPQQPKPAPAPPPPPPVAPPPPPVTPPPPPVEPPPPTEPVTP